MEARELDTVATADGVVWGCSVAPTNAYLLAAPTASLAGSLQVAARVLEWGLHKRVEIDSDVGAVLSGFDTCPLSSTAHDDLQAIGRTNDAVLYGGRAWHKLQGKDAHIEPILGKSPSSASCGYGTPFYDLFQHCDGDFHKIDPSLLGSGEVLTNNVSNGSAFHAGG